MEVDRKRKYHENGEREMETMILREKQRIRKRQK